MFPGRKLYVFFSRSPEEYNIILYRFNNKKNQINNELYALAHFYTHEVLPTHVGPTTSNYLNKPNRRETYILLLLLLLLWIRGRHRRATTAE